MQTAKSVIPSFVGGETAKAAGKVQEKIIDNRARRYEAREQTKRIDIQAAVRKVQVIEDNKSKRVKTLGDVTKSYINESDQILNSIDNPFRIVKKRVGNRIETNKLSCLSTMFLMSCFGPTIADQTDSIKLAEAAEWCKQTFSNVVDKMDSMNRTTSAAGLATYPDDESQPDPDPQPIDNRQEIIDSLDNYDSASLERMYAKYSLAFSPDFDPELAAKIRLELDERDAEEEAAKKKE